MVLWYSDSFYYQYFFHCFNFQTGVKLCFLTNYKQATAICCNICYYNFSCMEDYATSAYLRILDHWSILFWVLLLDLIVRFTFLSWSFSTTLTFKLIYSSVSRLFANVHNKCDMCNQAFHCHNVSHFISGSLY